MNRIDQLFDHMDEWRHLPSYQLERRSDIFFSVYLCSILEVKFGEEIEGIIPEFPVRIGTIQPEARTNRSFKIDYLAKVKGKNSVVFLELKTDDSSRRGKQDWYLNRAQEVGLVSLLNGLKKICRATSAKGKYRFLLEKLQSMGLLAVTKEGDIHIAPVEYSSKVVYLQPNNVDGKENVVSFREAAEIIERENDDLSERFAQSLREWARIEAGRR
jgi:hypothetical protein